MKTFNVYELRPEEVNKGNIILLAMTDPLVRLQGEESKLFRMTFSRMQICLFYREDFGNGSLWTETRYDPEEYGNQFTIVEIIHDEND